MGVNRKSIKGAGASKLRSQITTSDGVTENEVETWNGPYDELRIKQKSVQRGAIQTNLIPGTGGQATLTITRERETGESSTVPSKKTVEVIWQELRRPVESAPIFAELSDEQILKVKKAIANGDPLPADTGSLEAKLYKKLARGNTHYSVGVPVVRQTLTKKSGPIKSGNAYVRGNPPVEVEGGWQFLKTADERRKDGQSYTQVEEWSGADEIDADLYP